MTQTDSVVQEILALDQERLKAMSDADIDVLNRILSDDLSYVHTSAAVDTKESFTGALASGTLNYESIVSSNTAVRLYGDDTALVTGNADVRVNKNAFTLQFTNVYIKKDAGWQMVSWHATRLP
ncbi:MAG: nuclear transport factor 2 family protein [Chloroflexi bacterium]|nr:nuclear transport factor 2 family protein [Chloroflexota bacterium]